MCFSLQPAALSLLSLLRNKDLWRAQKLFICLWTQNLIPSHALTAFHLYNLEILSVPFRKALCRRFANREEAMWRNQGKYISALHSRKAACLGQPRGCQKADLLLHVFLPGSSTSYLTHPQAGVSCWPLHPLSGGCCEPPAASVLSLSTTMFCSTEIDGI